jgi:hypothetical protein
MCAFLASIVVKKYRTVKTMRQLIFFITCTFLFVSCKKENMCDCFKGTGANTREERTAGDFTEIVSHQDVNVILTPGTENKITVEAGENLVPLIETSIVDGALLLRNNNRCNWVRSFKNVINVYVTVKDLQKISVRGSGSFTSTDTLRAADFTSDIWSSGDINLLISAGTTHSNIHANVGDITLKGYSGVSYIYSAGNGFIHLGGLTSDYTFLRNKGTGDCYVTSYKQLEAEILHIGNVYYSGPGTVTKAYITGTGRLIPM